ncbi:MAG: hypothetical protein CM1200mP18_15870 [Gammaproteobacteria bacterium]|nr:MAG: hypothetical protein CM1200mP18_15870 [Gammaproteobacteria bacterium]
MTMYIGTWLIPAGPMVCFTPCWAFATGQHHDLLQCPFDVSATYRILETYGVTNVTTAPTVFRMMRAAGKRSYHPIPLH